MKTAFAVICTVFASCGRDVLQPAQAEQPASENIVPNPDFALNSTASAPPDGWRAGPLAENIKTFSVWGSHLALAADADAADGNPSVKLHGGLAGDVPVAVLRSEFFPITEGWCYELSARVKGNAGGGSSLVSLHMYDAVFAYVGQAVAFSVDHSVTTWSTKALAGEVWRDTARYGQVVLRGSPTDGSDVLVDAVSVRRLPTCDG